MFYLVNFCLWVPGTVGCCLSQFVVHSRSVAVRCGGLPAGHWIAGQCQSWPPRPVLPGTV